MGRYTNVQSYADDSPSMRSISYEQAIGSNAASAAPSSRSDDNDERRNNDAADEPSCAETVTKINYHPTKSDDADQQTSGIDNVKNDRDDCRAGIDPSSCDTPCLFVGGLHPRVGEV